MTKIQFSFFCCFPQGTNQQQDTRFSDKEKKLLKQMKFGDCLNKRVDMSKVKLDVLRPWISKKITDILHIEDDVVVEFVYNQLEEEKVRLRDAMMVTCLVQKKKFCCQFHFFFVKMFFFLSSIPVRRKCKST